MNTRIARVGSYPQAPSRHIYRVGDPPTTEIPLDGQGKWLSLQEDGECTTLAIAGPRGGVLAQVKLTPDLAELAASALLRTRDPNGEAP